MGTLPHSGAPLSLIDNNEAEYLTSLVKRCFRGQGQIVDGGCFVGASTRALVQGLVQASFTPNTAWKPVVSIDQFVVLDTYIQEVLLTASHDIRFGESFLNIFIDNLRDSLEFIEIRAGDLLRVGRIEREIEICFVDIAKTPALNAYVVSRWFPKCIPDGSYIIQQDLHSPAFPWLPVCMGVLLPHFDIVAAKIGESAVFKLRVPIPKETLRAAMLTDPISREGLSALEQLMEAFPDDARYMLKLQKCLLLANLGMTLDARSLLANQRDQQAHRTDSKWTKWLKKTEDALAMF